MSQRRVSGFGLMRQSGLIVLHHFVGTGRMLFMLLLVLVGPVNTQKVVQNRIAWLHTMVNGHQMDAN